MKDDWSRSDMPEDYAAGLHQRTEELYRIPDAEPDNDGLIECAVLMMRDMLVFPRMIAPVFVEPGPNLLAIQDSQMDDMTMIALVQQDPEVAFAQVARVGVLRVGRGAPLHTQVVQESGNVFVHLAAG